MSKRKLGRGWGLRHLGVALLLSACGGIFSTPTVGGESHFLRECGNGCGDGLKCVSDVCTRACLVGESSCADLSPAAKCTDASIEPGAIAVCDVACETASDCKSLGTSFDCEAGFCRGSVLPGGGPPGNAGNGAGGSSAPGNVTTLNCGTWVRCSGAESCAPGEDCIALEGCSTGICACPTRLCELNCSSTCTYGDVAEYDQLAVSCPDRQINGFEGGGGSGPYPPGYANGSVCGVGGSQAGGGSGPAGGSGGGTGFEPAVECSLPVEGGPCDAAMPRYAAVNGQCVPFTYGGCEGNDNNFSSLEECLRVCEGRPQALPCPEGRVAKQVCLECGPVGGCPVYEEVCTQPCQETPDCESPYLMCFEGTCQQYGCE